MVMGVVACTFKLKARSCWFDRRDQVSHIYCCNPWLHYAASSIRAANQPMESRLQLPGYDGHYPVFCVLQ